MCSGWCLVWMECACSLERMRCPRNTRCTSTAAAFLAFARAVTREPNLTKIDAQATCFQPGNFLTLHDDTGDGERRAAYTLGLTREWRGDWGGQLLFHDAGGDVLRGFKPRFNAWTVFRTPQLHSVSQVANYAAKPRLTVTGWLRDDPPQNPR